MNLIKANVLLDKVIENIDNPDDALTYLEQSLDCALQCLDEDLEKFWQRWYEASTEVERSLTWTK